MTENRRQDAFRLETCFICILGDFVMKHLPTRLLASLVVVGAISIPLSAIAGKIDLEDAAFDNIADSNYFNNGMDGQFWQAPETSGVGNLNGNLGTLAFDFGGGSATGIKFRFQQDGTVVFLNGAGNPTGDFIAPLQFSKGYASDFTNGSFTNGLLDPSYLTATTLPNGAFNPANGLQAFRFQWPESCPTSNFNGSLCSSNGFVSFQAILIEIDPEDFMLQFNYNNAASALNVPDTIMGSFKLGANTGTYNGPFLNSGPNFCFHDGSLVDCGAVTVAVPEPSTLPLLAAGLMFLGIVARRRRLSSILPRLIH
jgi:hypothetical protein